MHKHRFSLLALLLLVVMALMSAQAQRGTPYNYILQYEDEFETLVGMQSGAIVVLANMTNQPVTVTASIAGDPGFVGLFFDTTGNPVTSAQFVLDPGFPLTVFVAFQGTQTGDFSTTLTVTDGTLSDQVTITAHVLDLPGNFITSQGFGTPTIIKPGTQLQLPTWVFNLTNAPLTLTATMTGDPEFTLAQPTSVTLQAFKEGVFEVDFLSSTSGLYYATLYVTDGTDTDTVEIVVNVDINPHQSSYSFTVEPNGQPGGPVGIEPMLVYEMPDDTVKSVTVTNISQSNLDFKTDFDWGQNFTVSQSTFSLAPNASIVLDIEYSGPINTPVNDLLWVSGSMDGFATLEKMPVFLFTVPPMTGVTGGLDVPFLVDFGIVDTNTTKCEDVEIKNTTNSDVTISNIMLSGFSPDFSIQNSVPFTIPANGTGKITVCYTAVPAPFEQYDVLSFDYSNPGAVPSTGTIIVNLVGMPNAQIRCPKPSGCLAGWFEDFPITPIGTEKEFNVKLENFSDSSVTVSSATFETWQGADGVFTLLTQLPITVSVFDPAVPGSGQGELTLKYLPVSPGSVSGMEDVALMKLQLNRASCGSSEFPILGIPEDSVTQRKMNPLYPPQGVSAVVSVEGIGEQTVHDVTFYNNLKTPVTVTGLKLENGTNFAVTDVLNGQFPVTLQPNEDISMKLQLHGDRNDTYSDKLIVHSSHEHLSKDFPLYGTVEGIVGVDNPAEIASRVQLSLAPNPTTGPMTATLSGATSATYTVVDLMGRKIAEFTGDSGWQWNGITSSGIAIQPGVYFIRANGTRANGTPFSVIRQAVVMK